MKDKTFVTKQSENAQPTWQAKQGRHPNPMSSNVMQCMTKLCNAFESHSLIGSVSSLWNNGKHCQSEETKQNTASACTCVSVHDGSSQHAVWDWARIACASWNACNCDASKLHTHKKCTKNAISGQVEAGKTCEAWRGYSNVPRNRSMPRQLRRIHIPAFPSSQHLSSSLSDKQMREKERVPLTPKLSEQQKTALLYWAGNLAVDFWKTQR